MKKKIEFLVYITEKLPVSVQKNIQPIRLAGNRDVLFYYIDIIFYVLFRIQKEGEWRKNND